MQFEDIGAINRDELDSFFDILLEYREAGQLPVSGQPQRRRWNLCNRDA